MKRLVFRSAIAVYLILILMGVIKFALWGQVSYLYETYALDNLSDITGHPHFYRYILVVPVYFVAELFALPPDYIFSITCGIMVAATSIILSNILADLTRQKHSLAIIAVVMGLSFLMNGRGIFALLAMAILLHMFMCWHFGKFLSFPKLLVFTFSSLWLSTVSSGTFTVIYVAMLLKASEYIFLGFYNKSIKTRGLITALIIYSNIYFFTSPILVLLGKNVKYYGGYWEMLAHGVGKVLLKAGTEMIVFAAFWAALLAALFLYAYVKVTDTRPLLLAIATSVAGGMFGYSTLAMAFPPMLLLVLYQLRTVWDV